MIKLVTWEMDRTHTSTDPAETAETHFDDV